MKRYFMFAGGILFILTILIMFLSGTYSEHKWCEDYYDLITLGDASVAPEASMAVDTPTWVIASKCSGVTNNIYLSYYFIALSVALLSAGFVIRK